MNIDMRLWLWAAAFALFLGGCANPSQHGHDHNALSDHGHDHASDGPPREDHMLRTDQAELFVDFPVLTVGATSSFAAHFTLLDGYRPVDEGSVTVSLIRGNQGIRHTVDSPTAAGIFSPALQPKEAGMYKLIFDLKTSSFNEHFVLDSIRVYPDLATAAQAHPHPEEGNSISFLKEQAWKTDFSTAVVSEKAIGKMIPTFGTWKVAASDHQTVIAPSGGRVRYRGQSLSTGQPVKKGEVLMTLSSTGLTTNNLDTEIQNAKVIFEQAKAAYLRKKPLLDSRIITRTAFEEVEQKYLLAKSNFETLNQGYRTGGKSVVAPFDGYVAALQAPNGSFVEQGAPLFAVSRDQKSLLEIQVSPDHALELQHISDVMYQPAPGRWSSLMKKGGKVLSVGREVSPDHPLLSVLVEVREGIAMPKGSFTEAQIVVGQSEIRPAIPYSALLEDYGQYSVIVQLSGERFERRDVTIGNQNGDAVEVRKGLQTGEVVVSKGAYQVKMAAMAGQAPAHGHAH